MIAYVPANTPEPAPLMVTECRYQVRIDSDTYKCETEQEYQSQEPERQAQTAVRHIIVVGLTVFFLVAVLVIRIFLL